MCWTYNPEVNTESWVETSEDAIVKLFSIIYDQGIRYPKFVKKSHIHKCNHFPLDSFCQGLRLNPFCEEMDSFDGILHLSLT